MIMGRLSSYRIVISAGPTWEMIDPVRFLSNRSSGQLGYALARVAHAHGAKVTLISGPTALRPPHGVHVQQVVSAREMYRACMRAARTADIIIMTAAVADYRPTRLRRQKIKKRGTTTRLTLELTRNPDILATLCRRRRRGQYIVGFALESEHLLRNARTKLRHKGCDCIIANAVPAIGTKRHRVTIIEQDGKTHPLPALSKIQLARRLWSYIRTHVMMTP